MILVLVVFYIPVVVVPAHDKINEPGRKETTFHLDSFLCRPGSFPCCC
jgi:hypothetical protein